MGLKIDNSGRRAENLSGMANSGNIHVDGRNQSQFSSHLKRQSADNLDEMLKKMAQDIIKQGERLSERIDIAELKVYKRMLSEFLDESVRGFAKFQKESFMDRRGRHRLYATVKRINENLEELTKELLKSEKDHLKIIGKIEDIRGLILDIIL